MFKIDNRPFSERQGFVTASNIVQLNGMTKELSNDIWNYCVFFINYSDYQNSNFDSFPKNNAVETSDKLSSIWMDFFHELYRVYVDLQDIYLKYKNLSFYHKYDFLEYILKNISNRDKSVYKNANEILNDGNSGYRFINELLVPIHTKVDIDTIDSAIDSKLDNGYIENALKEASKKEDRNLLEIAELSINGVEITLKNICVKLFNEPDNKKFGQYIRCLTENNFIDSHKAYLSTLSKLYGYESDGGIRHPKDTGYNLDESDAIFLLSICSAFVSMLKTKYVEYKSK